MNLYVCDQGAHISLKENRLIVKKEDHSQRELPISMIDMVELFGGVQMTTQASTRCLKEHIPVVFYSYKGYCAGKLTGPGFIDPKKVWNQYRFLDRQEDRLEIDKKIVKAKINNQLIILRRYTRKRAETGGEYGSWNEKMKIMIRRIERATKIEELMGIEGIAAKTYFETLGSFPDEKYRFSRRSRRPPKDPVNAALGMGYTILMNEVLGKISGAGLLPEVGVFHASGYHRPALACDLMEEWRPIIVDSTVMSMFTGHEFTDDDFQKVGEAVYLSHTGVCKLIRKLQMKMDSSCQYLDVSKQKIVFAQAVAHQIYTYGKMLEIEAPELYKPIMLR